MGTCYHNDCRKEGGYCYWHLVPREQEYPWVLTVLCNNNLALKANSVPTKKHFRSKLSIANLRPPPRPPPPSPNKEARHINRMFNNTGF